MEFVSDERGVGEALAGDANEGAQRRDAGADDGHVGFEGGPNACVDVVPYRTGQICEMEK